MLKISWWRKPGQVLTALVVLASLSGVAQAQQSGLFPLHPIRRERVPCPSEDPIYKLYRSQYYGYFPTQWRPFPQGWNLPSPEGPNTKEALAKQPIEAQKPQTGDEGEGEEMQGQPPARPAAPTLPAIPPERSPFELDNKPDAGGAAPGAAPPLRPRTPQPSRPTAPAAPNGANPDLNPPGPAASAPRTSRSAEDEGTVDRDSGPLLAMPDATLPPVEEASAAGTAALASNPPPGDPAYAAPMASQQPARRSRLSSLFGGLGINWLRR
jgi:hypothetical protein